MITNNLAQLKTFLENMQVNMLARQTGFTLRQTRKINAQTFLLGFFQMMICGQYSLRSWARNISTLNGSLVSFQALAKKLDFRQEPFFHALFQKVLLLKVQKRLNFKILDILKSFPRVIIEDSTCFKLPKELFDFFPGARLPHGRMAGGRLQLRFNLKDYNYEAIAFQSYCQNDMHFADDILNTLRKGELIIRDLGYWAVPVFNKIIDRGAYFLSRLSLSTHILNPETQQPIDLVTFLKKKERRGIIQVDMPVLLSDKHRTPVRLIGIKLTNEQALKRRRMAKIQRHKDSPISERAFYLMSWNLFVTNVKSKIWDIPSVYQVYNMRWHIEMIFKCWKSKFNFNTFFKHCYGRNPVKPEILLLLILTWFVLYYVPCFNEFANHIWKRYQRILSPMRFADYLSSQLLPNLQKDVTRVFPLLAYYCCYDKRKDRLNHFEKTYMNLLS